MIWVDEPMLYDNSANANSVFKYPMMRLQIMNDSPPWPKRVIIFDQISNAGNIWNHRDKNSFISFYYYNFFYFRFILEIFSIWKWNSIICKDYFSINFSIMIIKQKYQNYVQYDFHHWTNVKFIDALNFQCKVKYWSFMIKFLPTTVYFRFMIFAEISKI